MKHLKKLLSLSLVTACIGSAKADYVLVTNLDPAVYPNESLQVELDGIDDIGSFDGSITPDFPIGQYGARYDLVSVIQMEDDDGVFRDKLFPLATTVVGPYPTASFNTSSRDPYQEFRTRADLRFHVSIDIDGFSTQVDAPSSMKSLYVEHLMCSYPEGQYSFSPSNPANWVAAKSQEGAWATTAGNYVMTNPLPENAGGDLTTSLTALPSPDDADADEETKLLQSGEERFIVYARPRVDADWVIIAEKKIRVFPTAQAEIQGSFDNFVTDGFELKTDDAGDAVLINKIPSLTAVCTGLYPASTTTLRLYKGSQLIATSSDTIVESSEPKSFNTVVPQDGILRINNTDIIDITDGTYTVKLETTSNIDGGLTEEFAPGQFKLMRSIKVRGNISTQN